MMRTLLSMSVFVILFQCSTNTRIEEQISPEARSAACSDAAFYSEFQDKFFQLRMEKNIPVPVRDPELDRAALKYATRLQDKESIQYEDSERPLQRLNHEGIKRDFVAENIARLKNDPDSLKELLDKWKDGSVERNNMIGARYHFFGFGVSHTSDNCFCVLILTD